MALVRETGVEGNFADRQSASHEFASRMVHAKLPDVVPDRATENAPELLREVYGMHAGVQCQPR